MTSVRARNARLLRRLVIVPTPDLVESFDDATPSELVQTTISAPAPRPDPPDLSDDTDFWAATAWWLQRLADPASGFRERMVWYWHGHLTSGLDKSGPARMLRQLALLRRHALGDFREMLREITLDPAMLSWLDGSGSRATAPNENYARELMELFALGRDSGAYTEADVHAGARALAGHWVDEDDRVVFEPDEALRGSVSFLGRRVHGVDGVIDAVCDRPECARHVVARLHEHFVGATIDPATHDRLAAVFRDGALDISVLVSDLLLDSAFVAGPPLRPRSALEWFLALQQLVGQPIEMWPLESLGQAPLNPPNVAGWPGSDRWASTGAMLSKGQIAMDNAWDTDTLDRSDPVGDLLRRAVLYEVSPSTRSALDDLAAAVTGRREQATVLHAAVAMCPEFSLI